MLKKVVRSESVRAFCVIILVILMACISSVNLSANASKFTIKIIRLEGDGNVEYRENSGLPEVFRKEFIENTENGAVEITGSLKVRLDKYKDNNLIGSCDNIGTISSTNGIVQLNQCFLNKRIKKSAADGYRKVGNNQTIPYIISPRYTVITTLTPRFEWNDTGSSEYTVSIYNQSSKESLFFKLNDKQFQIRSVGTMKIASISYPDSKNPLKANNDYLFSVKSHTASKKEQNEASEIGNSTIYPSEDRDGLVYGLNFRVIPAEMEIQADPLDNVEMLVKKSLYANAINILENLVSSNSRAASEKTRLYIRLGELYVESGLNYLAEQIYIAAGKNLIYIKEDNIKSINKRKIDYAVCNLNRILSEPQDVTKEEQKNGNMEDPCQ